MKHKHSAHLFSALMLSAIVLFAVDLKAQAPFSTEFSSGVKVNLPIGTLKETNTFGIGFDLQGEVPITRTFTAVGNVGLSFFLGRDSAEGTYDGESRGFIPFLAGVRYYVANSFFIGGQAGYAMYQEGFLEGPSTGGFSYAPQIGFNGPKAGLYLFYNATKLSKETEVLPTGNMAHIGGSILYRF